MKRLIGLGVTVGALAVPSLAAAAGWVTGPALSPPAQVAGTPMVALTSSGERIVAWEDFAADGQSAKDMAIRTAAPGAQPGAAQLLRVGEAVDPTLTVGDDGTVALVWVDEGASADSIHVARRAPGQSTFTEVPGFPVGQRLGNVPRVAVQGGAIYVAYETIAFGANFESSSIGAVRLSAGSQTIQSLDAPAGSIDSAAFAAGGSELSVLNPSIAVSGNTIYVAWDRVFDSEQPGSDSETRTRVATRPVSAGSFTAPQDLDVLTRHFAFSTPTEPQLAVTPTAVTAVWARDEENQLAFAKLAPTASSTQTIDLGAEPFDLHAGLDRSGALVLAFDEFAPPTFRFESTFTDIVPAAGRPQAPKRLTAPNSMRQIDAFAMNAKGDATVLIDRTTEETFHDGIQDVQASVRPAGGAFGALEDVSGTGDRTGERSFDLASVAVGENGESAAAWSADDGSGMPNERMFLSLRDDIPPTLSGIHVPRTDVTGAAVRMSAHARDAVSQPTVTWDLGDGARSQGASISHTYGAPGRYRVTVTATDSAGNTRSQSVTIKVSAARPVIRSLRLTPDRFRVGRGSEVLIAAAHRGAMFRLDVNQRVTLVISFTRKGSGRGIGTLVRAGRGPGDVSISFSGRIGRRALKPGHYVASVLAIGVFGSRSRSRNVGFEVTR